MQRFILPTSMVCAGIAYYKVNDFYTPKINMLRKINNEDKKENQKYVNLIRYKYMGNYYKCFTYANIGCFTYDLKFYNKTSLNYKKITKVEFNIKFNKKYIKYDLNFNEGSELSEWLGYHQDFHNLYSCDFKYSGLLKYIIYSLQMDEKDGIYQGDIGDLNTAYIDVYYDDGSIYRLDNNDYKVIQ